MKKRHYAKQQAPHCTVYIQYNIKSKHWVPHMQRTLYLSTGSLVIMAHT